MAATSLEFFVTAVDRASKVFEDVGKNIRTTEDKLKSFATGVNIAMAAAGVALVKFGSDSVSSASDLEESVNAVQVAYGDASANVLALGEDSATMFGMSKAALNAAAVQFSAFSTQIAGPGGDAAAVFESIQGRATDFASVMNLDVAEASSLFQSGLAGQAEPLRKYGIDLSAATVKAFAYANGIAETGAELTAAQKTQAAYGSMMEQTEKVAGDFANTSDGLANSQRIQAAQVENLKAKIGAGLLPIMQKVLAVGTSMVNWISNNTGAAIALIGVVGALAVALNVAANWTTITTTAARVATAAQWLWNAALTANPIGLVIAAIAALVAGLIWFFTKTEVGRKAWETMMGAMVAAWNWLWESVLRPGLDAMGAAWSWLYEYVIGPIIAGIQVYFQILSSAFNLLWAVVIKPILNAIGEAWNWLYNNVIQPVINGIKIYLTALATAFTWLWDNGISPVIDFISGAISDVGETIGDVFGNIGGVIKGAFNGVVSFLRGVINQIIDVINGATSGVNKLIQGVNKVPGVNFPNIPAIPKLASGGLIARGGMALVGERGPELVTLPTGSRVHPNGTGPGSGVTRSDLLAFAHEIVAAFREDGDGRTQGALTNLTSSTRLATRMGVA